jgi:hypothetical protein
MLLPPSPGLKEFTLLELVQSLKMEVANISKNAGIYLPIYTLRYPCVMNVKF